MKPVGNTWHSNSSDGMSLVDEHQMCAAVCLGHVYDLVPIVVDVEALIEDEVQLELGFGRKLHE
jgi:hypothetical protein